MNLNETYGVHQCKRNKDTLIVSDIIVNMNDNAKVTYYMLERNIFIGCKVKNTPRQIMKYHVFYIETHYDTLNIHIQKEKGEKHENKNDAKD